MYRRLAFAPLRLWLTNPRRALLFVAVRPYTMLPYKRLAKLAELADECNRRGIPGAFVQCGVWRGGSAAVLASLANGRPVELFDTFEGCPQPGPEDVSMHGRLGEAGEAAAGMHHLLGLLDRLDLRDPKVRVHPGRMEATLRLAVERILGIALLHLDCDWYESTQICMQRLYVHVADKGYVMADDFGHWYGAQKAVTQYFEARGLPMPTLTWVDHTGVFWKKA